MGSDGRTARSQGGACARRLVCPWLAAAALIAALVRPAPLWARTPQGADLDDASLEELMAIPLRTPAKVPQPMREAAGIGTLVTREQIDTYGWLTLNDILFRQPGFAPAQDFERVTVSARGLYEGWNNNHLLTLVDGVPFNNATNGFAYTWDVLPLLLVETVEVIRGPGSALYGTSATNGVVAIQTRSPDNARPLKARARLGNAGTQIYEIQGGYSLAAADLVGAYSYQRTDGNEYPSLDGSGRLDAAGAPLRLRINDRHSRHYFYGKVSAGGALTGLQLQVHAQAWDFQTGHGWLYVIPDEPERAYNSEGRVWLSYRPPPWLEDRLELELVLLGQRHRKDYRIKFLPNGGQLPVGGMTITYPGGLIEEIDTVANNVFARAQLQYKLWREMALLAGVENTLLVWGADEHHAANVNLNTRGGDFRPFPGNQLQPLRPSFEKVLDRSTDNLSAFAQLTTGRVFGDWVSATLGARYDVQFFEYEDITLEPPRPRQHRSFDQLSPRLGVVVFPHGALACKLLLERAFRAPSATELFVANTLLGSSNTENLQPEQITTGTLALDLTVSPRLTLRADGFYQRFANQIAFSSSQNLSANLYTRALTGIELEALFEAPLRPALTLGGFANYTFSHLLDETVLESSIAPSDRLTWAPAHVANAGLSLHAGHLTVSVQGHVQGRVERRDSDRLADGTPTAFSAFRPPFVAPWFQLDARVAYRPVPWLRVGVQGTNLLDAEGYLVKPADYPFDFRIEGLRLLATLELTLGLEPR
jgi:iron complex outermembrane receptor protein